MIIKGIIDEDFVNYKKPSMTIEMPICKGFKCGSQLCQNSQLALAEDISVPAESLIERYLNNPITDAIVFQGLEPFDTFNDLFNFIKTIRLKYNCMDDIVIYTGYTKQELINLDYLSQLSLFKNIIIKYGRYIPNHQSHYDEILGVNLVSENQYAEILNMKDVLKWQN